MYSLMALQLTMMEQCIIRLLNGGDFPAAYTTEGPHFLRKDSQKQPEAAHKSSTKPLYDGYTATRGEAQAGAR